jgi:hypothetical protein
MKNSCKNLEEGRTVSTPRYDALPQEFSLLLVLIMKRPVAAPFQREVESRTSAHVSASIIRPHNRVDYLSHTFPPLEHSENIKKHCYCGPTPESNWVIPGKLLVGAYPASQDDAETFELLTSILRLGVTQFICLQLEVYHIVIGRSSPFCSISQKASLKLCGVVVTPCDRTLKM